VRRYLSILEGPTPQAAIPVLFTEDTEIIEAVAEALAWRLQAEPSADFGGPMGLVREPAAFGKDGEPRERRHRSASPSERPAATLQRSSGARSVPEATPLIPLRPSDGCCAFCGQPFTPRRGGRPQRFCSPAHKQAAWDTAHPRVRR